MVTKPDLATVVKAVVAISLFIVLVGGIALYMGGGVISFVIATAIVLGLWYATRNYRIRIDRTDTTE